MRSAVEAVLCAALSAGLAAGDGLEASVYHVVGDDGGSWPAVLSAGGLVSGSAGMAGVFVMRSGEASLAGEWRPRVGAGAILVLEGASEIAGAFGFRPTQRGVAVRNVLDRNVPDLPIIWEKQLELPVFAVPEEATVFAEDRWTKAPLVAGYRSGQGAVLWTATSPGEQGHERYPYLLRALMELGWRPPFESRRLWAFFDSSYRSRVDLDYFARRWRKAGISALHVAAWHYHDPDPERDAYLARLIEAAHRQAIHVYAWLELPHVSERFWREHPEWREQTAILQDAHLDWRKLMNLANPDCARQVAAGVHRLIDRFDWDGVNLAELYFESLEGADNPARFTPMNSEVRAEFQARHGFDPIALFAGCEGAPPDGLRLFLDYRADLARRLQEQWIAEIEQARQRKPHLALVLTHVDDRLDARMRDLIGADAARLLPLLERHDFTFLVEDPATTWNLSPERYTRLAGKYRPLTPRPDRLAIDINIVERYQDVYPTKQQTGTELLRQIHLAALAFPRVAVYAEHSLERPDLPLLPSAAAGVTRFERAGKKVVVGSVAGVGVPWRGPALIDGRPWAFGNDEVVWLPAGEHTIEPGGSIPALRLLDFNGDLDTVVTGERRIEFSYRSDSRAFAVLDRRPARILVDDAPFAGNPAERNSEYRLVLPRGQHLVTLELE